MYYITKTTESSILDNGRLLRLMKRTSDLDDNEKDCIEGIFLMSQNIAIALCAMK